MSFGPVQLGRRSTCWKFLRNQRSQPFVVFGLCCGGCGTERAAMKPALERNDLVALGRGVQPGEFDGRLVGFGAGVTKECLSAEAAVRQ